MKKIYLSYLFCSLSSLCIAQEDLSNAFTDYMEDLMEEENSKLDFEEVLDQLSTLQTQPLDINHIKAEELSVFTFLDETDILNIIRHRELYGDYQTLYELKNIPSLSQEKINRLLPFITIDHEARLFSWKREWVNSKHTLYTHYQQGLQQKAGYIADTLGNTKYAGRPERHYLKYLFQTPEKISAGFLGEKDAGEKGAFDYYSAHLQLSDIWKFSRICVGDFKANFGQGVVIGTSSFFGKSAQTTHSYQQREGVQRYTSSNETNGLRGVGATFSHQRVSSTLFFSHRKKDATLANGRISSFKTDGLHRTESELQKRRNIYETTLGSNISLRWKSLNAGLTFLYYRYSDTLSPADKCYNRFRLKETNHHWNIGLSYKWSFGKFRFFGESALDANLAFATLNSLSVQPSSRLSLLLVQRLYQPEYQANHSNAFGENSRTENESGLYLGAKLFPFKRIVLSLYADVFRFPWPKYGVNYTSTGQDYLIHLQYNTNRWMNMQLRYKYKEYIEQMYSKQSLRYVNHFSRKGIQCQWLCEGNRTYSAGTGHFGWVISEDISYSWKRAGISLNLHHAYFSASNYNNRFYLYERDVLNTFSMPMLYGEGHRVAANLRSDIGKHTQLYINFSSYFYTDGREIIGNSNEQIDGRVSSMIKVLGRWKF